MRGLSSEYGKEPVNLVSEVSRCRYGVGCFLLRFWGLDQIWHVDPGANRLLVNSATLHAPLTTG